MSDRIYVPVGDKEDAHEGWVLLDTSEICPQCRKIECDCEGKEE